MVTETTGSLNWYEKPFLNGWWWSNGINLDCGSFVDEFLLDWSILSNLSWGSVNNFLSCNWGSVNNFLNSCSWGSVNNFLDSLSWSSVNNFIKLSYWCSGDEFLSSSLNSNNRSEISNGQSISSISREVILPLLNFTLVDIT